MKNFPKIIFYILFLFLILSDAFSQDKYETIDNLINKYYDYGQFNGSVLVAEEGNIILSKGYGFAEMEWEIPNTSNTKFRLGSITKQFTSMLIMMLVEEDKIDPDGKLSDYLPYYKKDIGDKITIHNLLTHTSGIPNYTNNIEFMNKNVRDPFTTKQLVAEFCSDDPEFEPGSKYSYSNSGYVILGAIIEEVTGKTYEEILNEKILKPLDMSDTGYDDNTRLITNRASGYDKSYDGFQNSRYIDMSIPFAAGSMYSTVSDMYKWDQALYTDKLVTKESMQKMFTPFLGNYGYGWHIEDVNIGNVNKHQISHSGGIFGFNTIFQRYPDDQKCIIILNNFSNGNIREMADNISAILFAQDYNMPKKSLSEVFYKTYKEKNLESAVDEFNLLKVNKAEYLISERELNNLGYNFLKDEKTEEAIEVFRLNVESFPESSNVYDSLGEAYLANGDKDLAIENYKKSVELNPENETGKKVLSTLQGK